MPIQIIGTQVTEQGYLVLLENGQQIILSREEVFQKGKEEIEQLLINALVNPLDTYNIREVPDSVTRTKRVIETVDIIPRANRYVAWMEIYAIFGAQHSTHPEFVAIETWFQAVLAEIVDEMYPILLEWSTAEGDITWEVEGETAVPPDAERIFLPSLTSSGESISGEFGSSAVSLPFPSFSGSGTHV